MKLLPAVVRHAERALSQALQFVYPSDAILRHYFRDHPELGQRDRALIADSVYTVLRRKRSLTKAYSR